MFKNTNRYWCLLFVLGALTACTTVSQTNNNINVLIVNGISNHNWQQTTKLVNGILANSQRFNISVTTAPAEMNDPAWQQWRPKFSDYDVIIQNTNNIKNKAWHWPKAVQTDLTAYVKQGGGLYILHSANNAFADWPEYNQMIGLGWRSAKQGIALTISADNHITAIPQGVGKNTYHGPRTEQVIYLYQPHPITEGLPNAWRTPDLELYKYARGPAENITVLSYAVDNETNIKWPVEWTINYGAGRVYNSSFGHLWQGDVYPDSYRCVGFQTSLIRTIEWLANQKITYAVPDNFPTLEQTSLVNIK